jgi:hypothetical protein
MRERSAPTGCHAGLGSVRPQMGPTVVLYTLNTEARTPT